MRPCVRCAVGLVLFLPFALPAQAADGNRQIDAVIARLFAAMRAADTAAVRTEFVGSARVISIQPGGSASTAGQGLTVDQFVAFAATNAAACGSSVCGIPCSESMARSPTCGSRTTLSRHGLLPLRRELGSASGNGNGLEDRLDGVSRNDAGMRYASAAGGAELALRRQRLVVVLWKANPHIEKEVAAVKAV